MTVLNKTEAKVQATLKLVDVITIAKLAQECISANDTEHAMHHINEVLRAAQEASVLIGFIYLTP